MKSPRTVREVRELLALTQVLGEMVAEGIVVVDDGVVTYREGSREFMVEVRVHDVTETENGS